MFSTTDVSQSTVDVNGKRIANIDEPDAYVNTTYTPSSDGYIVVAKDISDTSGIKTYLYDADSSDKSVTTTFALTVTNLDAISVTKPVKTKYSAGENFDYTGAVVTAHYLDGHTEDVTTEAVFTPENGAAVPSDDTSSGVVIHVIVSYSDLETGFDLTVGDVDFQCQTLNSFNYSLHTDTDFEDNYYLAGWREPLYAFTNVYVKSTTTGLTYDDYSDEWYNSNLANVDIDTSSILWRGIGTRSSGNHVWPALSQDIELFGFYVNPEPSFFSSAISLETSVPIIAPISDMPDMQYYNFYDDDAYWELWEGTGIENGCIGTYINTDRCIYDER